MNNIDYKKQFTTDSIAVKPITRLLETKIETIFDSFEKELLSNIKLTGEKYNDLKTSKYKLSSLRNFAKLNSYLSLSKPLTRSCSLAYKMGLKNVASDYNLNIDINLNNDDFLDIDSEIKLFCDGVSRSYNSLVVNQLKASLRNNDDFPTFVSKIFDYPDFTKSVEGEVYSRGNRSPIPFQPSKTEFVLGAKALVHKMYSWAKQKLYGDTSGAVKWLKYKTQKDEKVSTICREWEGRVLPFDKTIGIIPQHANCRCEWEEI